MAVQTLQYFKDNLITGAVLSEQIVIDLMDTLEAIGGRYTETSGTVTPTPLVSGQQPIINLGLVDTDNDETALIIPRLILLEITITDTFDVGLSQFLGLGQANLQGRKPLGFINQLGTTLYVFDGDYDFTSGNLPQIIEEDLKVYINENISNGAATWTAKCIYHKLQTNATVIAPYSEGLSEGGGGGEIS